jgi:hypothetical protein
MFFDNNFLFFVTATLDDSRRSSIKILKENHIQMYAFFPCGLIAFDSLAAMSINRT